MTIDRSEINRALAKAIAFKQCGKDAEAEAWAFQLVGLLECAAILDPSRSREIATRFVRLTSPEARQ